MLVNGNEYRFGRLVYLTIFRFSGNDDALNETKWTNKKTNQVAKQPDSVVICFDPSRSGNQLGQLCTRIDFYVKHVGASDVGNNGFFAVANIDVYNIGPALTQFLRAYNAYQDELNFQGTETKTYSVVLQVGYKGSRQRTTIFAGRISSFVMERQQNNTSVDNVWHLYCQFPTASGSGIVGEENKAQNDIDYTENMGDTFVPTQVYDSWENYLKTVICSRKREVLFDIEVPEEIPKDSFETKNQLNTLEDIKQAVFGEPEKAPQTRIMPAAQQRDLNLANFDKYYKIEYRTSRGAKELTDTKRFWQQKVQIYGWQMNIDNVQKLATEIAKDANCHARLESRGSMQYIYIYPAGVQPEVDTTYTIVDYQNLRKPPQVAANMLRLDMLMEPDMRPGDIIELQITKEFKKDHPHPTFQVSYSNVMANATTVFAGASFIGMHDIQHNKELSEAMAQAGNIFYTQYEVTFVEFFGSTHTNDWFTVADCRGLKIKAKEEKKEGPRGIRNNNPGNIKFDGTQWMGLATPPSDGTFCVFTEAKYGIRALGVLLRNYYVLYTLNTIDKIIRRFAPATENDTQSYIASVSQYTGYGPFQTLNLYDKRQLFNLVKAIIQHENGQQPYSDQEIESALY